MAKSKRLAKKQLKKQAGLEGKKVSRKELESLRRKEVEKQKRNAATLRRYNQNKRYLDSLDIPTDIISKSTSIKETKKRAEKYLAEQAKEKAKSDRHYKQSNLVARKINRLLDAGFTKEEAEKLVGKFWRPTSDKKIEEIILEKTSPILESGITFTAKEYLYIGAAETRGGFVPELYDHLSNGELAAQILDRMNEAQFHPDDSNSMYCVYRVDYDESKEELNHVAKAFYKRGYDLSAKNKRHVKLDSKQYNKLTISNRWNEHDFYSMVLNCINQMKNEDVLPFIAEMGQYCNRNGLPFMKNLYKY